MKIFTFKYDPHPRKSITDGVIQAVKTGKGHVKPDEILCKSVEDMMTVMTKNRFQVFTAIIEKSPESITDLAEVLSKDVGNVQKDVKILESLGLIKLQPVKAVRGEKLKPVALYEKIIFECEPKQEKKVI